MDAAPHRKDTRKTHFLGVALLLAMRTNISMACNRYCSENLEMDGIDDFHTAALAYTRRRYWVRSTWSVDRDEVLQEIYATLWLKWTSIKPCLVEGEGCKVALDLIHSSRRKIAKRLLRSGQKLMQGSRT